MNKPHCSSNSLSSPAGFNPWRFVAMWMVCVCSLLLWTNAQADQCPALLDHEFPRLQDEKMQSMCKFSGQVLLVVNTASYCGFTGQYEELENIHRQYKGKGFSVVGFPSNDFGKQEPKSNKEIAAFCNNTFGVEFPMFAKSSVRGNTANPLYKQLAQASGEQPGWNFHKYLINREGKVVNTFKSGVSPNSPEIVQAIRRALDAHPITKQ